MGPLKAQSSRKSRKEEILTLLRREADWYSGEIISSVLGISRAAVAKHITSLRQDGHAIDAAPRRGYRLLAELDQLDLNALIPLMNTNLIGCREWRFLPESSSTNTEALLWAAEGACEGSVVYAEHQTKGRGRKGHGWHSLPRGLQFSVILRPSSHGESHELLTPLGVVAVAEAIRDTTGLEAKVKEPNDVLVNGHKISGVLVETGFRGGEADWVVLGIGCNVNAVMDDFPHEIRGSAGSLLLEASRTVARAPLFATILERLEYWYACLDGNRRLLEARYAELLLHL